jgi:uncharacterized alpha-E superfamily protein
MLEGITYSTLRHGEGWYFLELGRYIERAQLLSRLLDLHFGRALRAGAAPTYLDWMVLLRFCTAFEAYCKVYTANIRRDRIAEFLLFDAEFPHSVRFAVERLTEALTRVAMGRLRTRRAACERLAGRLKAKRRFRPDRRADERRDARPVSHQHHGSMRADPRRHPCRLHRL